MSMVYCKKTRRQFLVGAGKTLLAIPLLPSLLPSEAYAQAAIAQKRLMMFWFDHGNLNLMWPAISTATTAIGSSGSKEVLLRSLGSTSAFSTVLNNPLYESLKNADQLSIIRGLDASATGAAHGNFALAQAMDRNSEGGFPTIDTVLEASKTLYPDSTPLNVRKAIRVDLSGAGGAFYQKVGSGVQVIPGYNTVNSLKTFYNEVFSGLTAGTTAPVDLTSQLKSNILNRVFGAYTEFKNSRRISMDDKARLDQHMGYLSDMQKSLAQAVPQITCAKPADPGSSVVEAKLYHPLYMDLLAVAFKCGLTKVAVMNFEAHDPQWIPGLSGLGTNVHDAMHGGAGNAMQRVAYETWWRYFTNMIADRFLAPLNVQEGNTGHTYIENMLTTMLCAGGMQDLGGDNAHLGFDSQQVMIGNMGGALRSGRYTVMPLGKNMWVPLSMPYNCFLITLLKLMGVPPSEYAFATPNGQGFGYYGGFSATHPQKARFYQPITEILT